MKFNATNYSKTLSHDAFLGDLSVYFRDLVNLEIIHDDLNKVNMKFILVWIKTKFDPLGNNCVYF
jgi:hypothetical protein